MTKPATFKRWRDLPHREVWVVDTEYYPGAGFANSGVNGDPITPLCLVAVEMRTGRVIRRWQDELGPIPPYDIGENALIISYMATAEFGFHIACGWGRPACAIDAYIEFRHFVNDGRLKSGDREKGFYSLDGALRYFCEQGIDTAQKHDMRDRILQGPPFTDAERERILEYCESDTYALARLAEHLIPTIRSLPHACMRADFAWATAQQERRGIPLDLAMLNRLRACWSEIQVDLVRERDQFGLYEVGPDGRPHFRAQRWADLVNRRGMSWPTTADGSLDLREQTFRDMAGRYPEVETVRELRYSMSKLRLNDLQVGADGRARTMLSPYGTKTGRNAPGTTKFIFGPAKWLRFLIAPAPGRVLVHRDYAQQEVRIAAVLSGDPALLEACESGDVYTGIATQLGFVRDGMTKAELDGVRAAFKPVVLGILYGLQAQSLMMRTGTSLFEAAEILARLRARFRVFEEYAARAVDRAGLALEIGTAYGWLMQCPPGIKARTVRNFPIQSTAAEVLHAACILAERRGLRIVAPVHDALMAECALAEVDEVSTALDRVMRDAGALVLRGYELPTDVQIIRPGERFFDKRGAEMWNVVAKLITRIEERRAAS